MNYSRWHYPIYSLYPFSQKVHAGPFLRSISRTVFITPYICVQMCFFLCRYTEIAQRIKPFNSILTIIIKESFQSIMEKAGWLSTLYLSMGEFWPSRYLYTLALVVLLLSAKWIHYLYVLPHFHCIAYKIIWIKYSVGKMFHFIHDNLLRKKHLTH